MNNFRNMTSLELVNLGEEFLQELGIGKGPAMELVTELQNRLAERLFVRDDMPLENNGSFRRQK